MLMYTVIIAVLKLDYLPIFHHIHSSYSCIPQPVCFGRLLSDSDIYCCAKGAFCKNVNRAMLEFKVLMQFVSEISVERKI